MFALSARHLSQTLPSAVFGAMAGALLAFAANGAPLPTFDPVNVCGELVLHRWVPERFVRGRPGFTGSLGHDRTFPASHRVVLRNYQGIDTAMASRINQLLSITAVERGAGAEARVVLLLPHANPHLLDHAASICVEAFQISGDEGGTWTRFRTLTLTRR